MLKKIIKYGFNKNGFHKYGLDKYGFNKNRSNINGYDMYGFDSNGFNKNGYDMYGFDSNGFNKNGYDMYNKNSGKGLKISALPIFLSKAYTNNSSKKLISDIKQLINNLYDNKQINKQVYNILNEAITYEQSTNVYDIYKIDS